jgi:hypothetical protein
LILGEAAWGPEVFGYRFGEPRGGDDTEGSAQMPRCVFVHDERLASESLRNCWGHDTIGYFASHNGYSVGGERGEQV